MLEVELRYKVTDVDRILESLSINGVSQTSMVQIVDEWYIPNNVHDRAGHDGWFDVEHGIAYRVRRTIDSEGKTKIILDSKQLTDANNHNTFKEEVVMEDDENAIADFLKSKNYYNWLTLDKLRRKFVSNKKNLVITMDTVAGIKVVLGLDTVLEIEYEGDGTREAALQIIADFASTLGLSESDQFDKSLTVESMQVLAKFE